MSARNEAGTRAPIPAVLADLLAGPALPGAACRGLAPAHDADPLPGETDTAWRARLTRAAARCAVCPARQDCAAAAAQQPARWRSGVWAGEALGLPRTHRQEAAAS